MPDEKKERHKKEYEALLYLFLLMLHSYGDDFDEEEALRELARLRAETAMGYAYDGFKMTKEEALLLLRNLDDYNLTEQDKAKRDRLVAAVNNIVDFSVCAEYQLYKKSKAKWSELGSDIDFEDNEELMDEFTDLCATYNDTYAAVEHGDIEYAMAVALAWLGYSDETYLEYMTQNDDRVRPWHYALQGFVEKAADFPEWMIPPIEWRCRCFLISLDGSVVAKKNDLNKVMAKAPQKPAHLDGVFDESVAKCGRIFGKAHPYFMVSKNDKDMLSRIIDNIKRDYYG